MKFIDLKWLCKIDVVYTFIIFFVLTVLFWFSLAHPDSGGLKYFWNISTFFVFCFIFPSSVIYFVVGRGFNGIYLFLLLAVSIFSLSYDYLEFKKFLLLGYALGLAYQSPLLVNIIVGLFRSTKDNRVLIRGYWKIFVSYFFLVFLFFVLVVIA